MTTFGSLQEALATLPPNSQIKAYRKTGGAPALVSSPTGSDIWDPAAFRAAVSDGTVSPSAQYILRPVVSGKMSSKKIQVDLSLSQTEQTVQLDTGSGAAADAEAAAGGYLLQESVMGGLMTAWGNDREDLSVLRDELKDAHREILELRLKVKDLEHTLAMKGKDEGLSQIVNNWGMEFLKGPGGAIAAAKFLGAGTVADAVSDAAKRAAEGVAK